MLQELLIALAILAGIVWLGVKLFGAFFNALIELQTSYSRALARFEAKRSARKKASLAPHVQIIQPNNLGRASRDISKLEVEFERVQTESKWIALKPSWERRQFLKRPFWPQSLEYREMNIADIQEFLRPDDVPWFQIENAIIKQGCTYPAAPPRKSILDFNEFRVSSIEVEEATINFDQSISKKNFNRYFDKERSQVAEYDQKRSDILTRLTDLSRQIQIWNTEQHQKHALYAKECEKLFQEELEKYKSHSQAYQNDCKSQKDQITSSLLGFQQAKQQGVVERIGNILGTLRLPTSIPRSWEVDFDEKEKILIVEIALPDVVHKPPFKTVPLKVGAAKKPLNQSERKELVPNVHPAIMLRVAYELFRNDLTETIKILALNGWVSFIDPTRGIETRAYTASLLVEHKQFKDFNLRGVDPLIAFQSLKGKSAGKIVEIIPIEPVLNLNKRDSRFVDAREVLNTLDHSTNLAAMDWQDFEHLIRELFEKEFSDRGGEVKVTQSSRDRGVDAIVFNPDPIHGGKYIIQAKCYTGTVDVSAVRDLCAVVRKEGASRGILVTTSTYGADAYAFANNEPVTLLNGAELLGLLKKHGYDFRINLREAHQFKQGLVRTHSLDRGATH
jgi:HJR/Mrr/RecB family endonuclease